MKFPHNTPNLPYLKRLTTRVIFPTSLSFGTYESSHTSQKLPSGNDGCVESLVEHKKLHLVRRPTLGWGGGSFFSGPYRRVTPPISQPSTVSVQIHDQEGK